MSQPPESRSVGQRAVRHASVLILYAALAALLTYPLITRLTVMEPGDTAYFSWAMGWTLHSLVTDPASLAHGNVYHPSRFALGMDEPIIGSSILMLPLWLLVDDAVLLLNLLRLTIYTLCGFGGYLLARQLGSSHGPAVVAGAAFAFSPMRIDQIGHLSTLGAQWLPLTLLFMHRFSLRGRLRDALLSAGFFLLAGYACGYHGLMGLVLLPFFALVLLWDRWRFLPGAVAAAIVVALGFLPLRALHNGAFGQHGFERGRDETLMYSASLESFLATSSWNRIYGGITEPFRDAAAGYLFPGLIVPILVLLGVYRLFQARRRPSRIAVALGGARDRRGLSRPRPRGPRGGPHADAGALVVAPRARPRLSADSREQPREHLHRPGAAAAGGASARALGEEAAAHRRHRRARPGRELDRPDFRFRTGRA